MCIARLQKKEQDLEKKKNLEVSNCWRGLDGVTRKSKVILVARGGSSWERRSTGYEHSQFIVTSMAIVLGKSIRL